MQYKLAKKWLFRARDMRKRLDALQEAKATAWARATSVTKTFSITSVQGSQKKDVFVSYASLQEEIERETAQLFKIQEETLYVIKKISNHSLAAVLIERYINNKTWFEIAKTLHYNYEYLVGQKHPAALFAVTEILQKEGIFHENDSNG